jgi:hypothetical protein
MTVGHGDGRRLIRAAANVIEDLAARQPSIRGRTIIMAFENKTFAFKLAAKNEKPGRAKWAARDGVAIAGCSDPAHNGDYRDDYDAWGQYRGRDGGQWC